MLDDLPFCTAECRLQACRTQVSAHVTGGGGSLLPDKAQLAASGSGASIASSIASSTASGLYATFKSWL